MNGVSKETFVKIMQNEEAGGLIYDCLETIYQRTKWNKPLTLIGGIIGGFMAVGSISLAKVLSWL